MTGVQTCALPISPWHVVQADSQRLARLNCIAHLLSQIPYADLPRERPTLPDRDVEDAYDDVGALGARRFVPETYGAS